MTFASADFYRAFEDRFRGPRATIKERFKVYLPFVLSLQEKCANLAALDIGCGRGEWLELLTEHGISAQGVDIDEGMLSDCRRHGLNVHTADALEFLRALPDESHALISGFHIAEHLPFDVLQELVTQALRVLQPGGLLILETPNPENIAVGTASFYLDPTHQRPLPPPLLAFLTEFTGFRRQKILRLQESADVGQGSGHVTLLQVLTGVSPDYAVVAQKDGPAHLIAALGGPFSSEHGVTLDGLAHQYQQQTESLARQTEVQVQLVEAQKLQLEARAQILEAQTQQAEARAQQAEARAQQAEARAQQAEEAAIQAMARSMAAEVAATEQAARATAAELSLVQVYSSSSWRMTKPWRFVGRLFKGESNALADWKSKAQTQIRRLAKPVAAVAIRTAVSLPALKKRVSPWLLRRYPTVHGRLRRFILSSTDNDPRLSILPNPSAPVGPYAGKRVAVLAPASSSGAVGGAERFYSGLVKSLSSKGCEVKLVYLTVDESNFENIQKGYRDFADLDLASYDLVISTKAPAYVVNHPNHILYLVHTVRVFYDMFDHVFPHANDVLKAQRAWIHEQDTEAFKSIGRRFSIGREVSARLERWNGVSAEVLHPPLNVEGLYDAGIGDYFYMPGRLHAWKRVDLAIRAVKSSSLPIRLLISGNGEAEQELRALAGNDPRIEFLGRVSDETLRRLYAGALGVAFLPVREDYGYVTLEAFASGKPVITCTDSGEPTAFVEDGVSGLVCEPNAASIKSAMEQLWQDRDLAARMGSAGKARIDGITWNAVTDRLLKAGFPGVAGPLPPPGRLKVAVLDMQPILPAVGGGRLRLLGLYHALGEDVDARYVGTYDWPREHFRRQAITPTLEEIVVPLSAEHHAAAADSARKAGGKTVIDMLFSQHAHLSPDYLRETFNAVKWADVVVFSHPWVAPLVSDELLAGKTVIYDSHNVEQTLRAQILDNNSAFEREVLNEVVKAERSAGDRADLILACSREDIDGFVDLYGWQRSKMRVFANGVFSSVILPASESQKREARRELGIGGQGLVGFFIGSDYAPNVEAGEFIVNHLAPALPQVTFAIAGGVCNKLSLRMPANVRSVGFLEEREKLLWLHASDFGVNPMFSGSGTNIKMFDFMSAGLPIVTTPIGARGIAKESTSGLRLADRNEFIVAIKQLLSDRPAMAEGGLANRDSTHVRFAWETISPQLGKVTRSLHFRTRGRALLLNRGAASKIKVAHLSTVGLKCGIGEYTRKVIEIYRDHGIQNLLLAAVAANEKPKLDVSGVPAEIVWHFDNVAWKNSSIKPRALELILEWGATHLLIQYHPGFYSSAILREFAGQVSAAGVVVTIVVHNYRAACSTDLRNLQQSGVLLFSHRMTEVMRARLDNVLLDQVPLAIDVTDRLKAKSIAGRNWGEKPPLLVTTGFLRKHKGVRTLIQAMPAILARFPNAKLRVQCATYPSEDSRQEFEACLKDIDRLNLKRHVVMDNRFLGKSEVLDELACADIAILPYDESDEGSSAAAADCMAVGLPLVVSTAEIFDEIRDTAFTISPSINGVVQGVLDVLSDVSRYDALSEQSCVYSRNNSWKNIVGAFLTNT